jgi:hypothetical protein
VVLRLAWSKAQQRRQERVSASSCGEIDRHFKWLFAHESAERVNNSILELTLFVAYDRIIYRAFALHFRPRREPRMFAGA